MSEMQDHNEKEAFFEELYAKYARKLERICLRYVNYNNEYRDIIDDCIQETFICADQNYSKIKTHPAIEGWLIKTCMHRLTTAIKKYRRRKTFHLYSLDEEKAPEPQEMISTIEAWIGEETSRENINKILGLLNMRESQVFSEFFLENHDLQEIAEHQGDTLSAEKSVLARIRRKIKKSKIFSEQD